MQSAIYGCYQLLPEQLIDSFRRSGTEQNRKEYRIDK